MSSEESTVRDFFGKVVMCNAGVVASVAGAEVEGRHVFICGDLTETPAAVASALERAKSVHVVEDLCLNQGGSMNLPASWKFTHSGRQFNVALIFLVPWSHFLSPLQGDTCGRRPRFCQHQSSKFC